MSDQMVPIYSCQGDARGADVMRKISLYANEQVCQIWAGSIGVPNRNVSALHLAEMLCEALEAQREREREPR